MSVQRALSFIPADWDWQTAHSAESGVEWRREIRDIFFNSIFPNNWLLGRGRAFDERVASMRWMALHPAYQTDYYVLTQNYHSGLASSLDYVGVLGLLFFSVATLRALYNSNIILRRRNLTKPWHIWITLMFLASVPVFWYTGFFDRSFPFFSVAFCLLEIARAEIESLSTEDAPIEELEAEYSLQS